MEKEQSDWLEEMKNIVSKATSSYTSQFWKYDEHDEQGFISDILDSYSMISGIKITRREITDQKITFFAVVDQSITSLRELHERVHQLLSIVDENFCVFIPLHTKEQFRFWYLTGTETHGHEGIIVFNKEDIPHIN